MSRLVVVVVMSFVGYSSVVLVSQFLFLLWACVVSWLIGGVVVFVFVFVAVVFVVVVVVVNGFVSFWVCVNHWPPTAAINWPTWPNAIQRPVIDESGDQVCINATQGGLCCLLSMGGDIISNG